MVATVSSTEPVLGFHHSSLHTSAGQSCGQGLRSRNTNPRAELCCPSSSPASECHTLHLCFPKLSLTLSSVVEKEQLKLSPCSSTSLDSADCVSCGWGRWRGGFPCQHWMLAQILTFLPLHQRFQHRQHPLLMEAAQEIPSHKSQQAALPNLYDAKSADSLLCPAQCQSLGLFRDCFRLGNFFTFPSKVDIPLLRNRFPFLLPLVKAPYHWKGFSPTSDVSALLFSATHHIMLPGKSRLSLTPSFPQLILCPIFQ